MGGQEFKYPGADKTQTFEFWPKEYGEKVICVKLTAKVLLFDATAKGQIICHLKNKSVLAEWDKTRPPKRQIGKALEYRVGES